MTQNKKKIFFKSWKVKKKFMKFNEKRRDIFGTEKQKFYRKFNKKLF